MDTKVIKPGYVYLTKCGDKILPALCINITLPMVQIVPLTKLRNHDNMVPVVVSEERVDCSCYAECYNIQSVPIHKVGRELGDVRVCDMEAVKETLAEVVAI